MRRLSFALPLAMLSCRSPDSTAPSASSAASSATVSATALPLAQQASLEGKVVAIASDGAALVQRGTHVDVFSPDRREVKQVALGDPAPKPGVRYAVSDKARYAARINDGEVVEVWDVAAGREVARIDTGEQSWGAPTFLGDDLMATLHENWVTLWDLPNGARRCTLKDPAIRLARESFVVGEGVAAVRGEANSPGVSNAVIVEFSTRDCALRQRHLVSARYLVRIHGSSSARFIFSDNRLRMRSEARTVEVALPRVAAPEAVFATSDNAVLWAGRDNEIANVHAIGVWWPEASRVIDLGRVQSSSYIAHVRIEGGSASVVFGDGQIVSWPLPAAAAGNEVRQAPVTADELTREDAIIQLGLDQVPAALSALRRMAGPEANAANRFFFAYVQSLETHEKNEPFLKRMKAEKIPYAGEPSTLAAANDLSRAQVVGPAFDMFMFWLEGAQPGSMSESGVAIGLELALQLSEADASEPRAALLKRLHKVYPQNAKVNQALKDDE